MSTATQTPTQTPINRFKKRLKEGELQIGCWAGFADPYALEMLATADFDWLVIDGEHAPNDIPTISAQVAVLQGKHSEAVVRLPVGQDWLIKQALDTGAQTLLIPMVETADQARELVAACRYPPEGIRGSGAALARASGFGMVKDYIQSANAEICVLVQVETQKGIDALDEILQVEGIDGVFIGPSDLANDMGFPGQTDHPTVRTTIEAALRQITAAGIAPGILALDDAVAENYRSWGAQFLAVGIDVVMFVQTARQKMAFWAGKRDGG